MNLGLEIQKNNVWVRIIILEGYDFSSSVGFWLILLPGMFISSYITIYFFVKNFFFECLYFSEYDIRMFLFAFWFKK